MKDILIISEFGTRIRKRRKRLLIEGKNGKIEVPVKQIRDLIILTKTSLSTDIMKTLIENGVEITICSYLGRPVARVIGYRIGGSSINRRLQYKAFESGLGVELAKKIIRAKIENQSMNLKYYSKSKRIEKISEFLRRKSEELIRISEEIDKIDGNSIEEVREEIMNIEGRAAGIYWESIAEVYGKEFGFRGRDQRGDDIMNIYLNISYNLLSIWVWKHSLYFSLDPYFGFLHSERPGKLSLVYDLMEPLRPLVDRLTIGYLLRKKPKKDFEDIRKFKIDLLEKFADSRVFIGNRKLRFKTAIFYYIQSVVSFLREGREIAFPKIYW